MKNNASISFFSSFLRACFDSALLSTEGILHLSRILMSKPYAWLVSASDISKRLVRAASRNSRLIRARSTDKWALCFPTVNPKRTITLFSVFNGDKEK